MADEVALEDVNTVVDFARFVFVRGLYVGTEATEESKIDVDNMVAICLEQWNAEHESEEQS